MILEGDKEEIDAINNTLIRNYFKNLTINFLKSFENYFN